MMERIYEPVQNIQDNARESIVRKTAYSLPDNPSASGMRPDQIRKHFWSAIIGESPSILSEHARIIAEVNLALSKFWALLSDKTTDAAGNSVSIADLIRTGLAEGQTLTQLFEAMESGNVLDLIGDGEGSGTLRERLEEVESNFEEAQGDIDTLLKETARYLVRQETAKSLMLQILNRDFDLLDYAIVDMSVSEERLNDEAVTTPKIANRNVTTEKIADGNVTTPKLADKGVTMAKIADEAVTADKIRDYNVTTKKIADQGVVTEKNADRAVTTAKLGQASVTQEKIFTGAVSAEKLSPELIARLLKLEKQAHAKITYDPSTGVLTFTSIDGSTQSVDLPLELIVSSGYYDEQKGNEAIVLVLSNGDKIRIPVDELLSDLVAQIKEIHDDIFVLQKAPPLAAMTTAITLMTPTLSQLAMAQNT
jgi:hypothetical protein